MSWMKVIARGDISSLELAPLYKFSVINYTIVKYSSYFKYIELILDADLYTLFRKLI